ncbi:radical SAM protein [Sphingomonas pokkalii]|uniref:Radical SAM superfamily enzyme n=1 Tax=Sphingomonas pokkalii TaxID=2175090 RepID=A0A2U0SDF8_9SPHN|nr:radical SAM protein [Sphingomonas pokkalii]PVX29360.1 radical SAM superfamily enzyme [Sphingomonas pokkalii]
MVQQSRAVIAPRELVINVTLRCPLKCAHCCFSSDMFQHGHLALEDCLLAIRQAASVGGIEIVHFVGGDPFLHDDIMREAYAVARALGLRGGATTSAYWGKTAAHARKVLAPLAAAGLTELTISYDDSHAEFVRVDAIRNAVEAALELGLTLRIAVTISPGARLTAAGLRGMLALGERADVKIYETPINATGRASETVSAAPAVREFAKADAAHGPCLSVLRTFTVNHQGAILPCCGVLPHYEGLRVGTLAGGMEQAVASAFADPLLKTLAFEGPAAVLDDLGEPRGCEAGVCEVCDRIFRDPAILARARERAQERLPRLVALETAFRGAGLFAPPLAEADAR